MQTRKDMLESALHTLLVDRKQIEQSGGVGFVSNITIGMLEDKIAFYMKVLKEDYGKDFSHFLKGV